MDIGLMG